MILDQFIEKSPGVFHAKSWNTFISNSELNELFLMAKSSGNKARLCLHPDIWDSIQITYLAFINPYSDKIHCHPFRSETIHVIEGKAKHNIYDAKGKIQNSLDISKTNNSSITIESGTWHNFSLISEKLMVIEIGSGPFTKNSTRYYQNRIQ